MGRTREQIDVDWEPVVGRALAFLCLHYAEMRKATLLEQADFLGRLGLPYSESAVIIGTTESSLKELARQKTQRKSTVKAALGNRSRTKATTRRGRKR